MRKHETMNIVGGRMYSRNWENYMKPIKREIKYQYNNRTDKKEMDTRIDRQMRVSDNAWMPQWKFFKTSVSLLLILNHWNFVGPPWSIIITNSPPTIITSLTVACHFTHLSID